MLFVSSCSQSSWGFGIELTVGYFSGIVRLFMICFGMVLWEDQMLMKGSQEAESMERQRGEAVHGRILSLVSRLLVIVCHTLTLESLFL